MEKEIIVVAEHRAGGLLRVSLELAAFGKSLARAIGARVTGLLLGHPAEPLAENFARESGFDVIAVDHENLALYNAEAYVSAISRIIEERKPSHVLIPHTATGWDYAARLAVIAEGSCVTGVTGFSQGDPPSFIRKICGGKILTEVSPIPEKTAIITVMPGAAKHTQAESGGSVRVMSMDVDCGPTRTLGYSEAMKDTLDLSKAEVIIAVGRGIGDRDDMKLIKDLAACFEKSAVGASRPVVDLGWLPLDHQVGQTGQTVAPRLYIACGISGAIQHTSGMSGSELIVAINTDPRAMIFSSAHIGVIQDLHEFLPILIKNIQKRKSRESDSSLH